MAKLAQMPVFDRAAGAAADPPRVPRLRTRYYAFLSYSHKDKELADWLHRELERFRVPRALAGKLTANGVVPRRLTPIFRDQQDLSAGEDLAEEIRAALAASQFLIVLCSPTAAKSRWTNQEVESFKRTRPEGCVLAAVVAGEPFASDMLGQEGEECFPPALRYKYDRRGHRTAKRAEPLAADFRESGEGKRLALLKLVAGMLGVDLDELVRREQTRRQRRLAWLAAASIAGMAVTSGLAVTAIQARDAARDQRREAEGLVAFMLGDLKDKLEPIGRLDALDGVGSRVLAYYSKQDTSELSDAALLQRSRALSLTAQVAYLRGNMETAAKLYREARIGAEEAVRRDPTDPQRLYDQAQNVFWIGEIARQQGDLVTAEPIFREYKRLAEQMVALGPDNMKWRMEVQYADTDLGIVLYGQRRFDEAESQFVQALRTMQALATADPRNAEYQKSLSQALAWLADARMSKGELSDALQLRERQIALLNRLIAENAADVDYRSTLVPAEQAMARLLAMLGRREQATGHLRSAVEQAQRLVRTEPNNTIWLQQEFASRFALAEFGLALHGGEAIANANAGCATVQSLLAKDPSFPYWLAGAADCARLQAQLALAAGAKLEALTRAQQAVAIARSIKSNDRVGARFQLAKADRLVGDIRLALGDNPGAAAAWIEALRTIPAQVAERPLELDEHAVILQRLGRIQEASRLREALARMGYRS